MDKAFQVVLGSLMIVLTVVGTLAVQGTSEAQKSLIGLTVTVQELTIQVDRLRQRVDHLPPENLIYRLEQVEAWIDNEDQSRKQHNHKS